MSRAYVVSPIVSVNAATAGDLLLTWGRRGCGPGEFSGPADLAVGPGGRVQVADTYNNRVQQIPTNIVASLTGFEAREFFEAGEEAQEAPVVEF